MKQYKLEKELARFKEKQPELKKYTKGGFVVINDDQVLGSGKIEMMP